MLAKSKNSYLVVIGAETNKYCFLYQPESYDCHLKAYSFNSVIYSFGGSRRSIFEQTFVGLHFQDILVQIYKLFVI